MWAITEQDEASVSSRGVVGWTALVPVEVVEERRRESSVEPGITDPEGMAVRIGPVQRRYATPWEAA